MKRSPIPPGKGFKPPTKPMARGTARLVSTKPMQRTVGLKQGGQIARTGRLAVRSKTNSDPRPKTGEAQLCRGQPCYLRVPGICTGMAHDPCHSNQAIHGKGKGIKAHDVYTVPGCRACHNEIDQGHRFTRAEKFAIWNAAYARWEPVRALLLLGM